MATVRITYTAGKFGIDDQGSVRFLLRFASDAGRPQFDRPGAPNYCTATASNGSTLLLEYHPRGAFRPWFKAIRVNVMRDALREGDTITLVLGDRSQGGAGWRTSTMREERFELRTQVDPFGTVVYGDVAGDSSIDLLPGEPARLEARRADAAPRRRAVRAAPARRRRLRQPGGGAERPLLARIRHADRRPAAAGRSRRRRQHPRRRAAHRHARARRASACAPPTARRSPSRTRSSSAPSCSARPGGATSTPRAKRRSAPTAPARYFEFARDSAFCDFVGHQGNDFQISNEFWAELNRLYREFHAPHRFVTLPGYEYSPMTHLGGDRNIFFFDEGRPIRRSSHALVEDLADIDTDCNHVLELFAALREAKERVFAFAHVGGRYADLHAGHDVEIERSVEVHSAWGTFEWLLFDAFELGYRVGVVCNSDDHKGRPGASHPGASIFGAYGGLSCLYLDDLTRESIWSCMQARHHYGTTGERLHLEVDADLPEGSRRYAVDPKLDAAAAGEPVRTAMMGDIVAVSATKVRVRIRIESPSPIERVDLRCGARTLETIRPYGSEALGRRVRVVWEGAEYRGRGRMTTWDGTLRVSGNDIESFTPINFWHLDKKLERRGEDTLAWESVTTGQLRRRRHAAARRRGRPHRHRHAARDGVDRRRRDRSRRHRHRGRRPGPARASVPPARPQPVARA